MNFNLLPKHGLWLILIIVSFFNLLGGFFAYYALAKIKTRKLSWELFAAYLMLLLSLDLLIVHLINWRVTELSSAPLFKGFILGIVITFLIMKLHHFLTSRSEHGHRLHLGVFLFLLLAIHEIFEGMGIAEIFFETTVNTTLLFTLFPSLILAMHEFPEGLILVLPFFLANKVRTGFGVVLINQMIFVVSGILFYNFFLYKFSLSIAEDAFLSVFPAGGIFYLGLHEILRISKEKKKLQFFYPNVAIIFLTIITLLGTIASIFLTERNLEHHRQGVITGYEIDPNTGEEVPIISAPCQNLISVEDCLH